jgi:hypothetical protein
MSEFIVRFATPDDYNAIIALQRTRYVQNLSKEERRKGFLSVLMTREEIDTYASDLGIVLACEGADLLGFFCLSRTRHWTDKAIIDGLLTSLRGDFVDNAILQPDLETCLLGPVCLSDKARGKNVFQRLHAVACHAVAQQFDFAISFISANNLPSLTAAKGVNTYPLAHYFLNERKYHSFLIHLDQYRSLSPDWFRRPAERFIGERGLTT